MGKLAKVLKAQNISTTSEPHLPRLGKVSRQCYMNPRPSSGSWAVHQGSSKIFNYFDRRHFGFHSQYAISFDIADSMVFLSVPAGIFAGIKKFLEAPLKLADLVQ